MLWLDLQRGRGPTLTRQLYDQLVARILGGELAAGTKLPSSRQLAGDLRVARNIVIEVYEQLFAEGYLEARAGSGTYVARLQLPDTAVGTGTAQKGGTATGGVRGTAAAGVVRGTAQALPLQVGLSAPRPARGAGLAPSLSSSPSSEPNGAVPIPPVGAALAPSRSPAPRDGAIAFSCGVPDLGRIPRARWLGCLRQVAFHGGNAPWGYDGGRGCSSLRTEIAGHLLRVKGIRCAPEQVVVTAGSAQAMFLLGLLFQGWRPGAIVEDPVISFVPAILRRCGHELAAVPVDAQGLVVEALPRRPRAGCVFVSPSHQFPLGGTLPIQRRLALLEYARRHDLFVVEDDYDSEFRFAGAPVSSLFRLDPRRVVHLGTFSKCLAPALRLGFLVLPEELMPMMLEVVRSLHLPGPRVLQEALARFIHAGHLDGHIARMKRLYHRKMRRLERALVAAFGDRIAISGNTTGLHLVATLRGRRLTKADREAMAHEGVAADAVDDYAFAGARHPGALVLGYGNLSLEEIDEGVRRLARALGRS